MAKRITNPLVAALLLAALAQARADTGLVQPLAPRPESADPRAGNEARDYADQVMHRLLRDQSYPREALANAWEGTVRLDVVIGRDGRVKRARINGSSGHAVLDSEALQKVEYLTELPDPPRFLRGREFTLRLPVVFRIDQ